MEVVSYLILGTCGLQKCLMSNGVISAPFQHSCKWFITTFTLRVVKTKHSYTYFLHSTIHRNAAQKLDLSPALYFPGMVVALLRGQTRRDVVTHSVKYPSYSSHLHRIFKRLLSRLCHSPAPIFTKLTNAQQHHVQNAYKEFRPNPAKVWLPL
jgi:hypothetical protein